MPSLLGLLRLLLLLGFSSGLLLGFLLLCGSVLALLGASAAGFLVRAGCLFHRFLLRSLLFLLLFLFLFRLLLYRLISALGLASAAGFVLDRRLGRGKRGFGVEDGVGEVFVAGLLLDFDAQFLGD